VPPGLSLAVIRANKSAAALQDAIDRGSDVPEICGDDPQRRSAHDSRPALDRGGLCEAAGLARLALLERFAIHPSVL
jgi:hypothetical protein